MNEFRHATRRSNAPWSQPWHRAQHVLFASGFALMVVVTGAASVGEEVAAPRLETEVPAAPPLALGDDELIIREVFRSHLPSTLEVRTLRIWVHPHLGDFTNKDHLRITTGMRYGLTANWEMSLNSDLYSSHGFGEVRAFQR